MKEARVKEAYDAIDLYDYLRVIWRWRWMIAIGVITVTLLAIPATYLMRTYESQGVLRLSEELKKQGTSSKTKESEIIVTLPDYKVYGTAFMDSRRFLDYLKGREDFPQEEMAVLKKRLMAKPVLKGNIKPVYAYTEKEIRIPSPEDQFISAVQLSWEDSHPDVAQRVVDTMGLFVKDTLEKKVMEKYITHGYQEAYVQVQELESKLADLRFSLKQNNKKLADLTTIAQRSPAAQQPVTREVVSVEQGGHRYLPPSTQAVAIQVAITDVTLDINDTERRLEIKRVKLAFFTRLKNVLQAENTKSLFDRLTEGKDEFFRGKTLKQDEILIVHNRVSADFARFEHWFRDVMQFVSGPTLPQRAKPSKRIVVAVTFFLGLVCFTILAFLLEFIQQGRQRESITKKQKTQSKR